jgi:ATP-dependent exoDNAse (exonuclease V) alpha subunit
MSMAQTSPFMTGATSLQTKTFGRSGGSSAPSAAAYRAGERIRDERTGRTYDHSTRQDVMHKEIVLPSQYADSDMGWARDRANLWNAAEYAESRKNARVAREYLMALPVELTPEQRVGLARAFSQELSDRYRFAVDLSIHAPRDFPGSDPRNFHAHLLATTREVATAGLAAKTTLELSDAHRQKLGLGPAINELLYVRGRWASVTNEALRNAQVAARVDHRTLEAQGIDREPRLQIPRVAFEMERHGYRSVFAERLREEHELRVQARQERAAAQPVADHANERTDGNTMRPLTLEEIRRQARENWLKLRQESANGPAIGGKEQAENGVDRALDDDLAH